jgi:hypothetical protein
VQVVVAATIRWVRTELEAGGQIDHLDRLLGENCRQLRKLRSSTACSARTEAGAQIAHVDRLSGENGSRFPN